MKQLPKHDEHIQCDELTDESWLVCDFNPCYLSGNQRELALCPFAIANGEGKKDCGYG